MVKWIRVVCRNHPGGPKVIREGSTPEVWAECSQCMAIREKQEHRREKSKRMRWQRPGFKAPSVSMEEAFRGFTEE